MFEPQIQSAKFAAERAAISVGGAIFLLVGVAFLTAAAWIAMAAAKSSLFAATVIGCVYAGVGLILFAVASMRKPPPPPVRTASLPGQSGIEITLTNLTGAFVQGIGAGIAARGAAPKRPRPPVD